VANIREVLDRMEEDSRFELAEGNRLLEHLLVAQLALVLEGCNLCFQLMMKIMNLIIF
jgi:hypothetical protein